MSYIEQFIEGYSKSNFEKIKFDWNGKHGNELEDFNLEFRMNVCEYLCKNFSIASDELILDLYQELSASAKEMWSIYNKYHLFAQEVLNRGKTKYLLEYAKGATQSFDTILASGNISLEEYERQEMIDFAIEQMKSNSNENQRYYQFIIDRFSIKKK